MKTRGHPLSEVPRDRPPSAGVSRSPGGEACGRDPDGLQDSAGPQLLNGPHGLQAVRTKDRNGDVVEKVHHHHHHHHVRDVWWCVGNQKYNEIRGASSSRERGFEVVGFDAPYVVRSRGIQGVH